VLLLPSFLSPSHKRGSQRRITFKVPVQKSCIDPLKPVRILDYRARPQQTSSKLNNLSHPDRPHYSETKHKIITLDIHKHVLNPAPYPSLSSLTSGLYAKERKTDTFLTQPIQIVCKKESAAFLPYCQHPKKLYVSKWCVQFWTCKKILTNIILFSGFMKAWALLSS